MVIYTCKLTFFALDWRISGAIWTVTTSCWKLHFSRVILRRWVVREFWFHSGRFCDNFGHGSVLKIVWGTLGQKNKGCVQPFFAQAWFTELLGVSPRVYNRWEKGGNVPHFDTFVKIADILQVTLDELAGRQEPSHELKIRNHELRQLCHQCDVLPDKDQQALIVMMDSLVKKSNMTKVIGKVAHG